MSGIQDWWSDGERVELGADGRHLFVRRMGAGPSMTLLHGFPSSSHDWAKVAPALAERHSLLMPDFLGFGASDKPPEHDYSLHEQADLVEALWARDGVTATIVVAHDYAVSVAQELLARRADGALSVDLQAVHLLNGGLYPDVHRPQPIQLALLDREQGPQISALATEELFVAGTADHVRRGLRRERRQRRHLGRHEPGRRPPHLLSPDPLPRGPPAPRAALDRRARGDRGPARVRLGDARPDLGRAHGRAHPRAPSRRALRGARGRGALASARGARARGAGAARAACLGHERAERVALEVSEARRRAAASPSWWRSGRRSAPAADTRRSAGPGRTGRSPAG